MSTKFTFITEDGTVKRTYRGYLRDKALMAKIADKRRIFINLGLTLFSYDKYWLAGQPAQKIRDVEAIMKEWRSNPVKYFMPQGARSDIGKSAACMFLNDMEHTITGIIAERYGAYDYGDYCGQSPREIDFGGGKTASERSHHPNRPELAGIREAWRHVSRVDWAEGSWRCVVQLGQH
jgi:hypothetical protein